MVHVITFGCFWYETSFLTLAHVGADREEYIEFFQKEQFGRDRLLRVHVCSDEQGESFGATAEKRVVTGYYWFDPSAVWMNQLLLYAVGHPMEVYVEDRFSMERVLTGCYWFDPQTRP